MVDTFLNLFMTRPKTRTFYKYYKTIWDIHKPQKFCEICGTKLKKDGKVKCYDAYTGRPVSVPRLYCPKESRESYNHKCKGTKTKDYWEEEI